MKDRPKLTIIVPMYNRQAYIRDCVESIRRQTYTDWELLLVDDGSTDETTAICRELLCTDERIKLCEQPCNQGVSAARNRGLELARGKYVAFVDSDDYLLPDGLAHMMKLALAGKADVVWSKGRYYHRGDSQPLLPAPDGEADDPAVEVLPADIGMRLSRLFRHAGWSGAVWNRVYRRDFLQQQGLSFPPLAMNEDTLFNFSCLCRARTYIVTSRLYYVYRLSDDSIVRRRKYLNHLARQVQDTFKLAELLWQELARLPYFDDKPELKGRVMERLTGYMLELPRLQGFYPTPLEHRQVVEDTICEALRADFGDKAWLVQFLYRYYMENQGSGTK